MIDWGQAQEKGAPEKYGHMEHMQFQNHLLCPLQATYFSLCFLV